MSAVKVKGRNKKIPALVHGVYQQEGRGTFTVVIPTASEVNQLNRLKLMLSNAPVGRHPDEQQEA